ncbi:MAG: tetratricopeptide repeat protein, partial [Planctomycetota bacterium]
QFAEAQPWFERAVAAKEQGDVHGRVDRAGVATSLRSGAKNLWKLGRVEDAQAWETQVKEMDREP